MGHIPHRSDCRTHQDILVYRSVVSRPERFLFHGRVESPPSYPRSCFVDLSADPWREDGDVDQKAIRLRSRKGVKEEGSLYNRRHGHAHYPDLRITPKHYKPSACSCGVWLAAPSSVRKCSAPLLGAWPRVVAWNTPAKSAMAARASDCGLLLEPQTCIVCGVLPVIHPLGLGYKGNMPTIPTVCGSPCANRRDKSRKGG